MIATTLRVVELIRQAERALAPAAWHCADCGVAMSRPTRWGRDGRALCVPCSRRDRIRSAAEPCCQCGAEPPVGHRHLDRDCDDLCCECAGHEVNR